MTLISLFINWDVTPELINLGGFSIRYYGLLFALAFVCGYKVEEKMLVDSNDEISISFSSKYMLDGIKSFETSSVQLCMNNDNSPIIIKSNEDDSLIQLVLPIKTY